MSDQPSRRAFLEKAGFGAAALGISTAVVADDKVIQGFEKEKLRPDAAKKWVPFSDRKIRLGIAGYGVCKFGAAFSFQNHPNVEVVAVSDLFADRCNELARICKCEKTYPSMEKMIEDDSIEAIFCATDAPSHARLCIAALESGKHVASAVPAVFGSLEDADRLLEAVKKSEKNYMLFETSCFHRDLYAMRKIYEAGGFGKLVYSEGEYFHYGIEKILSYQGWRDGLPPLWYPTHSTAYHVGISGESFTEVSCLGMPCLLDNFQPSKNRYENLFGTETALFRTSDGGMSRMSVSWDTPGYGGEAGRVRGQRGSMVGMKYQGLETSLPDLQRPALPPEVEPGGHGGSHGQLSNEFVMSILQNRKPLIDVVAALNMTVSGIVAHQSAQKDGELLKIPQYQL